MNVVVDLSRRFEYASPRSITHDTNIPLQDDL
jgi:hypothetical protein